MPAAMFLTGLVLVVSLSACTMTPSNAGSSSPSAATTAVSGNATSTTPITTPAPPTTPAPSSPTPTSPPTATPSPPSAATTPTTTQVDTTSRAAVVNAIRAVIQRANQEQEQALAANDPTVMRDTATTTYYNQLVQEQQSLSASGVTAIHLVNLVWGPTILQSPTTAQATTVEIWTTTFSKEGTLRETDTNVYTLVLQGGAWKIQSDQYPGTRTLEPPSGSSSPTPPGSTSTPPPGSSQSVNWAGYAATGGTFTAVSAGWTVPTVSTATTPAADATWVGIGGITSTDLIQAGTQAIVGSGQVTYAAWVETLPQAAQIVPLTVKPGDKVNVSIAEQSTGTWQIVIKNLTSGKTYTTTINYQSSLSSAEWIEESPSAGRRMLLPLDNFGSITFSSAKTTENGQQRTIAQANGQAITMEVVAGQALAQTSALGSDGSSFTVSRTAVPAPQITPGGRRFHG